MLRQGEFAFRQPMVRLLLGLFQLLDLSADIEFDFDHCNQALVVRTCHQFEQFELVDARHG